jgi:regulation of enolase protein 1 (concanavalin A-like superfamily)
MNLFDLCQSKTLASGLAWHNEPTQWDFNAVHMLFAAAPAYADYYQDPAGLKKKATAPFLHFLAPGDFILQTRLELAQAAAGDGAGLMLLANDHNWARLGCETMGEKCQVTSVVTRETSDDCRGEAIACERPCFSIARQDDSFTFHYSPDGEIWQEVRYFRMALPDTIKLGLVLFSPKGDGTNAAFDFLAYSPEPLQNIRSITSIRFF